MTFFNNGCCRFDGWDSNYKHRGAKTLSECQRICIEDLNCIACDVRGQNENEWDCYTFTGTGANFRTECSNDVYKTTCYKKDSGKIYGIV